MLQYRRNEIASPAVGVEDLCGRVVGGFVVGDFLDEGGYGRVYRARQISPEREVVVKVLRDGVRDAARLKIEAQSLARINHANSVKVIASGTEADGLAWIAMELVQGKDLGTWLHDRGPLPLVEVVPLIEQIAAALHAAHRRGIVHRDLKPNNVMVTPDEHDGTKIAAATLLDFGIARVLEEDDGAQPEAVPPDLVATLEDINRPSRSTPTTTVMPTERYQLGAHAYKSPEMWHDPRSAGPAADVYALGIIAYAALAGRHPFDHAEGGWEERHLFSPLPPIEGSAPGVFSALHSALSKRPEDRPSALDFAAALRAARDADPAQQAKLAARLWHSRGRPTGGLWDVTAITAAERRMQAAEKDLVTDAFFKASRARRWKRIAGIVAVAALGLAVFSHERAVAIEDRAAAAKTQAELDQGRYALQQGDHLEAQRHLGEAYRRGDHSAATEFMLARAMQPRLAELARFTSPSGHMQSATFSPDGRRIVTADDHGAQVWDAASKALLFTLPHGGTVYQITYSHDSATIVTACADGAVRIWDAATGQLLRELRSASRPRYFKLDESPDGQMVAAIDVLGAVAHVWDAHTGAVLAEIANDGSEFPSIAFSSDGRWLATTGGNNARVFSTATWAQTLVVPELGVRTFSWDPTSPHLVTGSTKGDASLWEASTGKRLHHLREVGEPIDRVAFAPGGELIVTASRDGSEELWSARSGTVQSRGNYLHDKIFSIEFDPSSRLVLASGVGAAAIMETGQGRLVAKLDGQGAIRTAHFDRAARRVVGASMDGTARIWDASAPYLRWASTPLGDCTETQALVPDRQFIATGCKGHDVFIWDTANDKLLAELPGVLPATGDFEAPFPAVSAAGNGAAIPRGDTVEVYEMPSGLVRAIKHRSAVSAVAFAMSGRDIISGSVDGGILVTRDNGAQSTLVAGTSSIDAVGFLPDGRLVAADAARRLRIYGPEGALLAEFEVPGRVRLLRASPDGRSLLAIANFAKAVPPALFDLTRYRRIAQLDGHLGIVYSARYVLDGREILTTGIDGTARAWDAATGQLRQTYRGSSRFLADATASPDGSMVVAGGADGLLRFWDLESGLPLWSLQAHKTALVGVHFEGRSIVTRGQAGDVSRWVLPDTEPTIAACGARQTCGIVPP